MSIRAPNRVECQRAARLFQHGSLAGSAPLDPQEPPTHAERFPWREWLLRLFRAMVERHKDIVEAETGIRPDVILDIGEG